MRRRKRHEEESNRDRWLISYADFITLLFAFFVVMYSISSVNEGKYRVLSDSIVRAFKVEASTLSPAGEQGNDSAAEVSVLSPVVVPIQPIPLQESLSQRAQRMEAMQRMAEQVEAGFDDPLLRGLISVERNKDSISVEINSELLFEVGSARLLPAALTILQRAGETLKKSAVYIEVEGFTDSLPINSSLFPSNWELSAARAASVVHLFTELGIDPAHMVALGYGEFRPKGDNGTETGRKQNRRVVLVITTSPRHGTSVTGLENL